MSHSHIISLKTFRKIGVALQDFYPERLHCTYFIRGFWNIFSPFLDPVTRKKVVFVNEKVSCCTLRLDLFFLLDFNTKVHLPMLPLSDHPQIECGVKASGMTYRILSDKMIEEGRNVVVADATIPFSFPLLRSVACHAKTVVDILEIINIIQI